MGDAYVAGAGGAEGVWWNPAAVVGPGVEGWVAGDRPFGISALDRAAGMVRIGGRRLGGAVSHETYGSPLYREAASGAVIGLRVDRWLRVGVRARRLDVSAAGGPRRSWFVLDVGFLGGLGDRFTVGAAAWNAAGSRTRILGQGGMGGVRVLAAPNVWLLGQLEKETGRDLGGGIGIEWEAAPGIWLRGGAGGQPERTSLGLGVDRRGFAMHYAALHHTRLGVSHRLTVTLGTGTAADRERGVNLTP